MLGCGVVMFWQAVRQGWRTCLESIGGELKLEFGFWGVETGFVRELRIVREESDLET